LNVPTFVKYLLLETPGWLLAGLVALAIHQWLGVSGALTAVLLAIWIAKDLVLYPWLKDAFSVDATSAIEELVGATGVVKTPLDPIGLVQLGAELWRAEASPRETGIPEGRGVRVKAVRGLTVVVVDCDSSPRRAPDS
jgi:membrane protein implicated in regulation of membrane protease activity